VILVSVLLCHLVTESSGESSGYRWMAPEGFSGPEFDWDFGWEDVTYWQPGPDTNSLEPNKDLI